MLAVNNVAWYISRSEADWACFRVEFQHVIDYSDSFSWWKSGQKHQIQPQRARCCYQLNTLKALYCHNEHLKVDKTTASHEWLCRLQIECRNSTLKHSCSGSFTTKQATLHMPRTVFCAPWSVFWSHPLVSLFSPHYFNPFCLFTHFALKCYFWFHPSASLFSLCDPDLFVGPPAPHPDPFSVSLFSPRDLRFLFGFLLNHILHLDQIGWSGGKKSAQKATPPSVCSLLFWFCLRSFGHKVPPLSPTLLQLSL